ncbi:hypothetical protein UFOVP1666_108 [uncultured Caudovirales phage]|uniref:Uncharacterized protein n=1 Tax=uncultured Caudovirales phage TaxID=2100421 RepID=A0A6J5T5L1_9CAUD|nr:hypothetical protein UFOVP867_63 [uncultured Caudovirales phage]CAB4170889.1 hypothetical protein UFOVP913_135 [uncultured Caudovirales phage]CAB4177135.1 hypothetical protein UFOVP993_188 [uncultured Caudovirales phage]CAB4223065.1 hypothetical protein UFOVP1666_108 [uncultured Caudovirales phage]
MKTKSVKTKETKERIANIARGTSGEPVVTEENYNLDLAIALNWYNINEDVKKMRKHLSDHLARQGKKEFVAFANKAWDVEVQAPAVLARLLDRDQYVSDKHKKYMATRLDFIKDKYQEEVIIAKATAPAVVSVDQRVADVAHKHAAEFDNEIDLFLQNKKSEFSAKNYLKVHSISGAVTKKIGDFYKNTLRELQETLKGDDADLNEGYSYLTKSELKKFLAFVEGIVSDCNQQVVSAKSNRMPRKRKERPAGILVAKLRYMKEFLELGLKSVFPTEIIGSTELWVYNTKTRRVSVYRGLDGGTLSVRGTTILNYDTTKSETKTLRKPEEFFKTTSLSKRVLSNAMKAIKTKTIIPNGRINEETILLGALK